MAKAAKPAREQAFPHLAGAFICERALQEVDHVLSAIRIVDRIILSSALKDHPPQKGSVVSTPLVAMFLFKAGDFKGTLDFVIHSVGPSDKRELMFEKPLEFDGKGETGHNLRMQMHIKWDGEGLYWFEVYLGTRMMTRMPLRMTLS